MHLFTRQVGSGPLVVVLHGGPGASHDYLLPQYDLLAQGRSLFYYDQRGGGQSPASRDTPVGWQEHVADLEGIRAQLGLERSQLARKVFGDHVVDFYVHTARLEVAAFDNTVTDWERQRYFERI